MTYQISTDLIENPSTRCACMVVLDTSGSMSGQPIHELNNGIKQFISALKEDEVAAYSVDVGIISAGGQVTEILPFTTAMEVEHDYNLSATGNTPLGEATRLALQRLEQRKNDYKRAGVSYYQPWLVIISDGVPTDSYEQYAQQAKSLSEQRKLVVMPLAVNGADINVLDKFSHRGAKKLNGLKFSEFFEWLSASMSRVSASTSTSASITLPSTGGWDSI